jgi:hypothetical protein
MGYEFRAGYIWLFFTQGRKRQQNLRKRPQVVILHDDEKVPGFELRMEMRRRRPSESESRPQPGLGYRSRD